jgi:hypothetical protein
VKSIGSSSKTLNNVTSSINQVYTTTSLVKKSKVKLTTQGQGATTSSVGTSFTVNSCVSVTSTSNCSSGQQQNQSSVDCFCLKTSSNLTYLSDYANTSSQAYINFVAAYKLQVEILY